jgi:hypothetical protein
MVKYCTTSAGKLVRTPIGCSRDIVLDLFHSTEIQRYTKVRELHIARLGRQDVGSLEITMNHLNRSRLSSDLAGGKTSHIPGMYADNAGLPGLW